MENTNFSFSSSNTIPLGSRKNNSGSQNEPRARLKFDSRNNQADQKNELMNEWKENDWESEGNQDLEIENFSSQGRGNNPEDSLINIGLQNSSKIDIGNGGSASSPLENAASASLSSFFPKKQKKINKLEFYFKLFIKFALLPFFLCLHGASFILRHLLPRFVQAWVSEYFNRLRIEAKFSKRRFFAKLLKDSFRFFCHVSTILLFWSFLISIFQGSRMKIRHRSKSLKQVLSEQVSIDYQKKSIFIDFPWYKNVSLDPRFESNDLEQESSVKM